MKMVTEYILDTEVWIFQEEDIAKGEKERNYWRPMLIDMRKVDHVERCDEHDKEAEFPIDGLTILHLSNGRSFTVKEEYTAISSLFVQVKTQQNRFMHAQN